MLPFKCVFVDVEGVADEVCLEKFSPRLGAFIVALKYVHDLEPHRDILKKALERLDPENASLIARIKELEAALAAKNG